MTVPNPWRGLFNEEHFPAPGPRAAGSIAFARLLELSGATDAEFAERLGLAVGYPIRPGSVRAWCDPTGPMPPAHWLVAAARIVGPAAAPVLAALAC